MSHKHDYESQKRERAALRGQQRRLVNSYVKAVQAQNLSLIETMKDSFLEKLEAERHLEWIGVNLSHYPIFFDNVFTALGFGIYRGAIPTLSSVQPSQPFHVAYDVSRMIMIRDYHTSLFAEIADVQPIATKPILGVCHNTWVPTRVPEIDTWERNLVRVSTALGIGRLRIDSPGILRDGIRLDPRQNAEELRQVAKQIGLTDFLSLPVDNLPIYGAFRIHTRRLNFDEKNVKRMLFGSIEHGHRLAIGSVTSMDPQEALEDPELLIRRLGSADLIQRAEEIRVTPAGKRYITQKLVGTPQEAALLKTADFSIFETLHSEFNTLAQRLDDKLSSSKQEIIGAINEVKLQIKETGARNNISAKYVIETPPASPFKLRIEIPIGEISPDDIRLKIAEIRTKVQNLPSSVVAEFKNSLKSLPNVPRRVKESLMKAI